MYDVHILVMDEFTEVVICFHGLSEVLLGCLHCRVQMLLVHVAESHHAATLVADEMEVASAYTAHSDDASSKLIAGSHVVVGSSHLAHYLTGKDGEEGRCHSSPLQETSSVYCHVCSRFYSVCC